MTSLQTQAAQYSPPLTAGANITRVLRSGEYVAVRPVLMDGAPILLKDDEQADDARGQIFELQDEGAGPWRAIEVWVSVDPVTGGAEREVLPGGKLGRVRIITFDLYKRRNGTIFRFPVDDTGASQTVSNLQQTGNRMPVDLYKAKRFVWATGDDVIALRRKGIANQAAVEARKRSEDPVQAQRILAQLIGEALRENKAAEENKFTLAGTLKDLEAQERAAGQRQSVSPTLPTDALAAVAAAQQQPAGAPAAPAAGLAQAADPAAPEPTQPRPPRRGGG